MTQGEGASASGFDPSRCDDCGGINPAWFAPNAVWNLVMGGVDAKGDPGGLICPNCFISRAEKAGIRPAAWELRHEAASDWNFIDTAPRDRPVLAWWPHLERPVIAWISRGGASFGKWTFATYKFEHQTPVRPPTHWAELPKPPSDSRDAEERLDGTAATARAARHRQSDDTAPEKEG